MLHQNGKSFIRLMVPNGGKAMKQVGLFPTTIGNVLWDRSFGKLLDTIYENYPYACPMTQRSCTEVYL